MAIKSTKNINFEKLNLPFRVAGHIMWPDLAKWVVRRSLTNDARASKRQNDLDMTYF